MNMKKNNKLKLILLIILSISLSSCDFSEVCIYFGTFKASIDWSEVDEELPTPSVNDMRIVIYPLTGDAVGELKTEPVPFNSEYFSKELWVGLYDAVVYNPSNLSLFQPSNSKEVQLVVSTENAGKNVTYIKQELAPVYVAGQENINIQHEDTTSLVLKPEMFLQELQFKISIKNMLETEVIRIEGELDGIATGKYLISKGVNNVSAIMKFSLYPEKENNALFYKSSYILGINPIISNLLNIKLIFKDNHEVSTQIDLSDKLKKFVTAKALIEIEVETGEFSTEASVADWEEVDWGELVNK